MASRRIEKMAEAIRKIVGTAIHSDLRDPRVKAVTVLFAEVSPDMRNAKVHISIMGDEKQQQLTLKGLQNSAGFLQKRISEEIETRYIPRLTFKLDHGLKNAIEVARILKEVLPEENSPEENVPEAQEDTDQEEVGSEMSDDDSNFSSEDVTETSSNTAHADLEHPSQES